MGENTSVVLKNRVELSDDIVLFAGRPNRRLERVCEQHQESVSELTKINPNKRPYLSASIGEL